MKIEKFVIGQAYSLEDILDSFPNADFVGLDNEEDEEPTCDENCCCCDKKQECEDNKAVLQMYAQFHSDEHDRVLGEIKKTKEKLCSVDCPSEIERLATKLRRLYIYRNFIYDITLDLLEEADM